MKSPSVEQLKKLAKKNSITYSGLKKSSLMSKLRRHGVKVPAKRASVGVKRSLPKRSKSRRKSVKPPKRVSPKRVSPKRASPKRVSTKRASPKRVSTKRASPKRVSTKRASPKRASSKRASPKRASKVPWAGWAAVKPSTRERTVMLEKCGTKCFLGPNKSFPICAKNTCKIDNRGVWAAYVRARQWGSPKSNPSMGRSTYQKIALSAKSRLKL